MKDVSTLVPAALIRSEALIQRIQKRGRNNWILVAATEIDMLK